MKIKILVVFLGLLFSLSIFSQEKMNVKDEQITKGQQIIENARKKIGADNLISNLNSFQSSIKSVRDLAGNKSENTNEINIMLPDKIFFVYSTPEPSEYKSISIWKGEKYKKLSDITFDGQRTVRDVTNRDSSSILAKSVKDKEILENIKKAQAITPKKQLNDELWNEIFPLILMHPFETQAEFRYVGKAKSADREANVVDTTTESGHSIRLLFDSETSLLLLMIEKYKSFDGDYETKYYYSDRELVDNVLIPKKIKVEHKYTPTGKDTRVSYRYNDIVEFKINPKFKPNLFDVN